MSPRLHTVRTPRPVTAGDHRIVPVDEVITIIEFFQGDEPLYRLMLDDPRKERLDRLRSELRFLSQDAIEIDKVA